MSPHTQFNAAEQPPQQALAEISTHVQLILNKIQSFPQVQDLDEALSQLAEPIQALRAELCRVRALEPHVEYIPKVLVSLDAHLNHPTGPFPNFIAIANEDTSVDPHHPWLKKVPIEVDGSTDREAKHPPKSGKSTPCPTTRPQEKGEHQGSRKTPYTSYREGFGVLTKVVEGGLNSNTTPMFASEGKSRARSFSLQSTGQPSADVEHTSAGAGIAEPEPVSKKRSLPESTALGPSAGEPQPRSSMKRTFEASHPPSSSSIRVCGQRSAEDRIYALEAIMLQLLQATAHYQRQG